MLAVVVGITAGGSISAPPVHAQSDREAVIAVATRFFDGMRARDTAMMSSTVKPTAMLVIPAGPPGFHTPMSIGDFIRGVGKGTGPGGDEQIEHPDVRIDGALASLWAYYTYTPGGQTTIDHCGVDEFLMQKDHDGWKIFELAGTIRKTGCTAIRR